MDLHFSMANIKNIACMFPRISNSDFSLFLAYDLVANSVAIGVGSLFFSKFFRSLESHLDRIFEAHFSNSVNEPLLACGVKEVFQMEAANW